MDAADRQRRIVSRIVLTALLLAAVVGVGWWTYEVWPRTLARVDDAQASLASELPKGSSESDALAFLRRHGYDAGAIYPTTSGDAYLRAQGVPAGTRALWARHKSRGHLFADWSYVNIWIVFDSDGLVDRTYVYGQ